MPIKQQTLKFGPREYRENGRRYRLTVTVRHDDSCGNGQNSFAVTGEGRIWAGSVWREDYFGCCHDEIARHFPELAHLIKWHLCDTRGPTHYIANTTYHAREHGPQSGWLYFTDRTLPVPIVNECMTYGKVTELQKIADADVRYVLKVDEKTAKVANLEFARSSAVWPDATLEQLRDVKALEARLPALLVEFRRDVEALGLIWD